MLTIDKESYVFNEQELKNRGFEIGKDIYFDKIMKGFNLNEFDDEITEITKKYDINIKSKEIYSNSNETVELKYIGNRNFVLHRIFKKGEVKHECHVTHQKSDKVFLI